MKIFLDSADIETIKKFWDTGILCGVTTNPLILSSSGIRPAELINNLRNWFKGKLFIQATGENADEIVSNAKNLFNLMPETIIIKISSTRIGIEAISKLAQEGIPTAATALFGTVQGICAAEANASFLIPFYDRLERSGGNPVLLLKDLVLLQNETKKTKILVASLKNAQQIENCLREKVWGVTVPPHLLEEILHNPLTIIADENFKKASPSDTEE